MTIYTVYFTPSSNEVVLKGIIYNPVNVVLRPTRCDFGEIESGQKFNKKMLLQDPVVTGRDSIEINSVSTTHPNITAVISGSWLQNKVGELSVREKYIDIALSSDFKLGAYEEKVVLHTNMGIITVPVTFSVTPIIEVLPKTCIIYLKESNSKKIQLKSKREQNFTIDKIKYDKTLIEVKTSENTKDQKEYKLDVTVNDNNDLLRSQIELSGSIQGRNWSVTVPVVAINRGS